MGSARTRSSGVHGFSLVEMLLSVVLGALIVLATVSVFLSGRRTMAMGDALSRTQESTRTAFELVSRDLREAGANPCSSSLQYGNVLNARASAWWADFNAGLRGYTGSQATLGTPFGAALGQRIAGTPAFDVHMATAGAAGETSVTVKMAQGSAPLDVRANAAFQTGDIAVVCDTVAGYVFQITGAPGAKIPHASGSGSPGNCAADFTSEFVTCNGSGTGYLFASDASVAKTAHARWYIGSDGRGGRSLFRAEMVNRGASATPTQIVPAEVSKDVSALAIGYLLVGSSDFVDAAAVTDWRQVRAVQLRFTLSSEVVGQTERIARSSTQVVALRNRTP